MHMEELHRKVMEELDMSRDIPDEKLQEMICLICLKMALL